MSTKRAAAQPVPITPDEAIDELRQCAAHRDFAVRKVAVAVEVCRLNGATWDQIGVALGMTRQGAHEAFSRPVTA